MDASGLVDLLEYLKKHNGHVRGLIIIYVLEAIAYYKECVAMYKQAKQKFESDFGPLQASSSMDEDNWAWADMPLPWEGVR